jgi:hypothetical protein
MHGWYWGLIIGGAAVLIVGAFFAATHRSITGWLTKPHSAAPLHGDPEAFAEPLPLHVTHPGESMTARELEEEQRTDGSAAQRRP